MLQSNLAQRERLAHNRADSNFENHRARSLVIVADSGLNASKHLLFPAMTDPLAVAEPIN